MVDPFVPQGYPTGAKEARAAASPSPHWERGFPWGPTLHHTNQHLPDSQVSTKAAFTGTPRLGALGVYIEDVRPSRYSHYPITNSYSCKMAAKTMKAVRVMAYHAPMEMHDMPCPQSNRPSTLLYESALPACVEPISISVMASGKRSRRSSCLIQSAMRMPDGCINLVPQSAMSKSEITLTCIHL